MPSSAANQSARAFSIVSAISARSCAGRTGGRQIGAIDREMQHVEFERLPQAVGGKVARRVVPAAMRASSRVSTVNSLVSRVSSTRRLASFRTGSKLRAT